MLHLVDKLGNGAAMVGSEVVQCAVVQSLAKICGRYTCSVVKTVTTRLV